MRAERQRQKAARVNEHARDMVSVAVTQMAVRRGYAIDYERQSALRKVFTVLTASMMQALGARSSKTAAVVECVFVAAAMRDSKLQATAYIVIARCECASRRRFDAVTRAALFAHTRGVTERASSNVVALPARGITGAYTLNRRARYLIPQHAAGARQRLTAVMRQSAMRTPW